MEQPQWVKKRSISRSTLTPCAAVNASEQIERQVFDILAVNVEDHLPSFDEAHSKSKKFTFRLLAQAIRENPDSVRLIMDEVLNLKKGEQDDLATLLRKTTLSKIITSAKIVADRLNFVEALSDLLFNKESKKRLLERDQLHKGRFQARGATWLITAWFR
jgi:Cdc6-like AAA superfamily ATPase